MPRDAIVANDSVLVRIPDPKNVILVVTIVTSQHPGRVDPSDNVNVELKTPLTVRCCSTKTGSNRRNNDL